MAAEPMTEDAFEYSVLKIVERWINRKAFRIDNRQVYATTSQRIGGPSTDARITFKLAGEHHRYVHLTHPEYLLPRITVGDCGRLSVPQNLLHAAGLEQANQVKPLNSSRQEVLRALLSNLETLFVALKDVNRCGIAETRTIKSTYTLSTNSVVQGQYARGMLDILADEVGASYGS